MGEDEDTEVRQSSLFEGSSPLKITKPIRLIECFAGIGAQAKALENLGVPFEHYRAIEIDKYAVASYNAIHSTSFEPTDITKLSGKELGISDTDKYTYILTYSFPCQDLSVAGKQHGMAKGSGTRSGLLWEVERLLTEVDELPQILLMENVPQVIADKNVSSFSEWISFLDSLGYTSKYQILNAKHYNIPQSRQRCFMVSWLGDYYYDFPTPVKLERKLRYLLEDNADEKYFLSDTILETFIRFHYKAIDVGNGYRFEPVDIESLERERERERERVVKCITTRPAQHTEDNFILVTRRPDYPRRRDARSQL